MDEVLEKTRRPSEKSYRYPLYERFLFVVPVLGGIAMVAFWGYIRAVLEEQGKRGWAALAFACFVLVVMVAISLRAWLSKIIISSISIKAKVFGQGYIRISWHHVVKVIYKWRLLGHKLVLVGSDGATIGIRSSISDYDTLLDYIHENVPDDAADQLEEIFGEPEEEEVEEESEETDKASPDDQQRPRSEQQEEEEKEEE